MDPYAFEWRPNIDDDNCNTEQTHESLIRMPLFIPNHDYSYEDTSTPLIHSAFEFTPQSVPSPSPAPVVPSQPNSWSRQPPICRFFLRGACRNGIKCSFRHDAAQATFAQEEKQEMNNDLNALPKVAVNTQPKDAGVISLGDGIQVKFGPGASVLKLTLGESMTASKIIIITGIPLLVPLTEDDVRRRLQTFGTVERPLLDTDKTRSGYWFVVVDMEEAEAASKAVKALHESLAQSWIRSTNKPDSVKELDATATVVLKDTSSANAKPGVPVKVQWYAPSRCAWVYFYSADNASRAAEGANGKYLCGRTITTSVKSQTRHIRRGYRGQNRVETTDYFVWVGNLGEGATEEKVQTFFERHGRCKVKSIRLGDLPFHDSKALMVRLLSRFDTLISLDMADVNASRHADNLKRKALARFDTAEAANAACRYFARQTKVPELGGGKMFSQRIFSVKYSLPATVFDALKRDIFARLSQIQGSRYQLFNSPMFQTISITADTQAQIDEVKTKLDVLVEGEIIRDTKNGNAALWNRYICSSRFQMMLPTLVASNRCAIWSDRRRQQIRVFGDKEDLIKTIKTVLKHCADASSAPLAVPIAESEFQYLLLNGRSAIDKVTAATKVQQISVDIKSRALLVQGGVTDSRRVKAYISKLARGEEEKEDSAVEALCPVCFCPTDEPVQIECGHVYCKECFDAWVGSGNIRDFPLVCLAEDCDKGLELRDLESSLDDSKLNNLLRLALDCHVRAHPDKYQFCLSPTCPGIYVVSKDSPTSTCCTCSLEVCLECNANHGGVSCDDYRLLFQPPEKLRMQIIDQILTLRCPRCKQAFYDFDGCFAIKCGVCPCSFCGWCLQDCGADAHAHVRCCRFNTTKHAGTYFGSLPEFEAAQKTRQTAQLKEFLSKLSVSQKELTLKELEKDLADLKIRL